MMEPINIETESWDQMNARHERERDACMQRVASSAYRKGLDHSPLNIHDRHSMLAIHLRVAEKHGFELDELKSERRDQPACLARYEAWAKCKDAGFSLPQIGKFCGGRDHTTILSGLRRYEQLMAERTAQ